MIYEKLSQTMRNLDEGYLFELLGELKSSLVEWSFDGKSLTLKQNLIDVIIAIKGLELFGEESFRYNFLLATNDNKLLDKLCCLAHITKTDTDDYFSLSSKISKVPFKENAVFEYLIHEYLVVPDYVFKEETDTTNHEFIKNEIKGMNELYDYQYMIKQQAINDLSNEEKGLYKILIHMPTGTGKTKTTMHIISHYINHISKANGLVVWIAHSDELLKQAYETFKSVWEHLGQRDITVYKGWNGYPDNFESGILFTSIQALLSKMKKPIFDYIDKNSTLIVFDEVHKAGASKYKKCVDALTSKQYKYTKSFIGLTATPGRTTEISRENEMFSGSFDHIIGIDVDKVISITLNKNEAANYSGSKEVIPYFQDQKILARLNRKVLDYELDSKIMASLKSELKKTREDYSEALLEKIGLNKARNTKIVEELRQLNENKVPTIVFACSLQHAQMLSAFLKLLDIPNSLVYGDMSKYEREKAIKDFKDPNSPVKIIINYEILTTGFDSTNIRCVFITRPTKSVILYSQMIGRGLRGPKMGGNEECLLIDVKENLDAYNENDAFRHFDDYWR